MSSAWNRALFGVGALTALSSASDFYIRNFYWRLDQPAAANATGDKTGAAVAAPAPVRREDFTLFLVRYDRISKPAACTCTRCDPSYKQHAIFAPRNGAVIRARVVPEHPNWVQLPPGDYVERRTCNVDLLDPVTEAQLPRPMSTWWNVQYETAFWRECKKREDEAAAKTAPPAAASKS